MRRIALGDNNGNRKLKLLMKINELFKDMRRIVLVPSVFLCMQVAAQDNTDRSIDGKEAGHNHHHHHKNEIGVANSPVYMIREKTISYGLHFHYIRSISESKFGLGAGYERIFDAHGHNTFGVVVSYVPVDKLSFIVSPGVVFENNIRGTADFAMHFETAYEFVIENFHLGPVLELAYDPEDIHLSIGMHIGIGF